nr:hypothetical protein CTI12_AA486810 [Tanacetum cinerariifolium]
FFVGVTGGIMVRNTSTIQDTNGWCWKFRNNKQDSSIPIRNQFHKEVEKIASSFYITNCPDHVDAKRLWVECQSYGRIVDAFIANKRSKAGKRFGFVRFLGVKNEEQLARNSITSQKADHVGSSQNKKSYASFLNGDKDNKVKKQVTDIKGNTLSNVPLTPSLITPALVLDDSCVSVGDLSRHVMGRVKDLNYIPNLRTLLTKEGFSDVKLTYLSGMWVMISSAFTRRLSRVNASFRAFRQLSILFPLSRAFLFLCAFMRFRVFSQVLLLENHY